MNVTAQAISIPASAEGDAAARSHPVTGCSEADVDLMLAECARFARQSLAPHCARPEIALSGAQQAELQAGAVAAGLLSLQAETGFGLWDRVDDAQGVRLSLGLLEEVAACSAGLAWSWHRQALACRLLRRLGWMDGLTGPQANIIWTTGLPGFGRGGFAAWLAPDGPEPGDDDAGAWLNEAAAAPALLAPADWSLLLLPCWLDGGVQWALVARDDVGLAPGPPPLGLDELRGFQLRVDPAAFARRSQLAAPSSRALLREVLVLDALAGCAIAAGSLQPAATQARSYAGQRRQGGVPIREHPAVQLMLADIEQAVHHARMLGCFQRAVDQLNPGEVLAFRLGLHNALCRAADQAVQLHGGIGYMRDCGVEKILRDQQMLRILPGRSSDLRLFLHYWSEAA